MSTEARRRRGFAGFTLLELLVVVAIMLLLGGILFPSLRAARAQAGSSKCASNLRAVGQIVRTFADEHGDEPAPTVWQRDTNWNGTTRRGWDIEMGWWAKIPNGAKSVWSCAAQGTPFRGNSRALGVDRTGQAERGEIYRVPTSRIVDPARIVLCYDLQYNLLDGPYSHALRPGVGDLSDENYPWPLESPWTVSFYMPEWGPHRERYGVLYCDGHAEVANYETG